jgi:hypothetical protein
MLGKRRNVYAEGLGKIYLMRNRQRDLIFCVITGFPNAAFSWIKPDRSAKMQLMKIGDVYFKADANWKLDVKVAEDMKDSQVSEAITNAYDASRTLHQAPNPEDAELLKAVLDAKKTAVEACKTMASKEPVASSDLLEEDAFAVICKKAVEVAAPVGSRAL